MGSPHLGLATLMTAVRRATGEERQRRLHELQEWLVAHFRAEESEQGWFAELRAHVPEVDARLLALQAEHLELAAAAVALLARDDDHGQDEFLAALRRHESEETELYEALAKLRPPRT